MANILDYLDWRGDLPLSVVPFNEVDNLVLSTLAYIDFSGLVPGVNEPEAFVTAAQVQAQVDKRPAPPKEEGKEVPERFLQQPILLKKAAGSVRFGQMKIRNYMNIVDPSKDEQLAAVTFELDDGSAYVAFRGTDDSLIGWKEDFNFSYMHATAGQLDAVRYLNGTQLGMVRDLRVGGHSKGGNFAVYAAAFCNPSVRERITRVYSNDGPGFIECLRDSQEFAAIIPRIRKYTPAYSVIGILMSSEAEPKVVKSTGEKVMQHDAFTWQVMRNSFVEADQRERGSLFFDQTMRTWISGESTENRKFFVNTLFHLLGQAGAETFSDVSENKTKMTMKVLAAMKEMPKESRDSFIRIWMNLAKSQGVTWLSGLQGDAEQFIDGLKDRLAGADESGQPDVGAVDTDRLTDQKKEQGEFL